MYASLVKYITFPWIAKREGLGNLVARLHFLEKSQWWSPEQLQDYQFRQLKKLINHAYTNTTFYRRRFDEANLNPKHLQAPEDLKVLPFLTKNEIRENLIDLQAQNLLAGDVHYSETGGTTGVKMRFSRDNACLATKEALRLRFESWAGWKIGEPMGLVWPATVDYVGHHTVKARIKNAMYERQVVLPAAILDDLKISSYLEKIRRKRVTFIRAFSSPIFEIARYMLREGVRFQLKGVVTTGEPLFPHQRLAIEEAFQCPVLDSYRCREVGPIAQQCSEREGLHVNTESIYLEIDGQNQYDNSEGEFIVTDFENYGMPLIRYRMGDFGKITASKCACGRHLPVLRAVSGRTADTFVGADGRRIMSGAMVLYLVDEAPGMLGQVQLVQDRIDHLTIRLTPDPPPSDEIKQFQVVRTKELLGENVEVTFEIVPSIPRGPSGKYAFTICNVTLDPHVKENVS